MQGRPDTQGGGWIKSHQQNSLLNKDSRVSQLEQEVTMLEEELVRVREVASIQQQQMSSSNRWGSRTTPPPSTDDSRLLLAMQDRERKTKAQVSLPYGIARLVAALPMSCIIIHFNCG